jgi:hypothetical protein
MRYERDLGERGAALVVGITLGVSGGVFAVLWAASFYWR